MKAKNKEKIISPSNTRISQRSALPSHANNPMVIDLDNVSVRLGGEQVLNEISLCIHAQEFVGIVGPNGAGKTTLLRTMLGLQKPNTGSVHNTSKRIGYVPQRGNIYDGQVPISVLEVVMLGSKGAKAPALEALRLVSMQAFAHRPFTELSGGQQQRVAIAKALASDPDVLLLDEPTTGIDEHSQQTFYDLLRTLQKKDIGIVIVSHDVEAVLNLVTRVLCVNQAILYDGPSTHFSPDKYLPEMYRAQHRLLHHHEETTHA